MELTLSLPPADAARLRRLPIVKAARTGRSRGNAVRIVWHDSLDRTLASRGLSLAEQRGAWRLERYRPAPSDPWPPATDHQVIQTADALDTLRDALLRAGGREADVVPDAITPVAAFEGRQTVFPLTVDGEAVSMTLLEGVLRAVAAEQPATRLSLAGPAFQVRTVMRTLVETLPLAVPEHSLAAEALRLADGTDAVPRRHGAPVLPPNGHPGAPLDGPLAGMSVHGAFAHITGHLTDVILNLAPLAADPDSGPEPVHQMRVAVRRARSAFSIFPPVPDDPAAVRGAAGLRRLGQMLGPARDWDVFMTETAPPAEAALPGQPALLPLLRAGARRRRAARMALIEFLTGPAFRLLTLDLACVAAADAPTFGPPAACLTSVGPPLSGPPSIGPPSIASAETTTPLREFAAGVLQKRWKKLLNAGKALDDLDSPGLHRLRLKAKRLRYAAEFFAPMFPGKPTSRFIRRLAALQERLGLFNDTTVAEALLRDLGAKPSFAAGLVLGFTAAQGVRARPKIAAAWSRFRRREPFWT